MAQQDVNKYLNMDINDILNLKGKELTQAKNALRDAANKRYKRATSKGQSTNAVTGLTETGGKISFKGKSGKALNQELRRAYYFNKAKTSTFRGFSEVVQKFNERIGAELNDAQFNKMWDLVGKMDDLAKNGQLPNWSSFTYNQKHEIAAKLVQNNDDIDDILANAERNVEKAYMSVMDEKFGGDPYEVDYFDEFEDDDDDYYPGF